jgi:glutaconate CoA-transferase subunit B
MSSEYTLDELMAAVMSREIRDGDWVNHGASVPLAGAALMLAKHNHAPNIDFFYLGTVFNGISPSETNLTELMLRPELAYVSTRALISHYDILSFTLRGGVDLQFLRPLQIDANGSVNVSVIGDPSAPRYRFHGIAVGDVMLTAKRPVLYVTEHNTRTFVSTLSFCTGLGHVDGDEWRKRIAAPGNPGGPAAVVTPLCVLDFDTPDLRARIRSVHPGVTVEEVQANTGFELSASGAAEQTEPPTERELQILRDVVDPLATRQMEFKATRAEAHARIAVERRARRDGHGSLRQTDPTVALSQTTGGRAHARTRDGREYRAETSGTRVDSPVGRS